MEIKNVKYHALFGKVEDLETGEISVFKITDEIDAELYVGDTSPTLAILDGWEGRARCGGRLGLKIAFAKALRKYLKAEIQAMEEEDSGN